MLDTDTETQERFDQGLTSFITYRMSRVQNRLNAQAIGALSQVSDLTLTEWRTLSMVNALGETSAAAICREAQMDKGQISRALKGMMARGLVTSRGSQADHRQTLVALSPAGQAEFDRLLPLMRQRQERLARHLSDAQLDAFFAVLDQFEAELHLMEQDL